MHKARVLSLLFMPQGNTLPLFLFFRERSTPEGTAKAHCAKCFSSASIHQSGKRWKMDAAVRRRYIFLLERRMDAGGTDTSRTQWTHVLSTDHHKCEKQQVCRGYHGGWIREAYITAAPAVHRQSTHNPGKMILCTSTPAPKLTIHLLSRTEKCRGRISGRGNLRGKIQL